MEVTWPIFKAFVDARGLSIQWIDIADTYYLKAFDGPFCLECKIYQPAPEGDALTEFEASYKDAGNRALLQNVQTIFEKNDKTLKMASARADFDENGIATIEFCVPGTPGSGEGRYISDGIAWVVEADKNDRVKTAEIIDEDDLLGLGAGTVLRTYHDDEIDDSQSGWRIPFKRGHAEVETIAGYGFIPSGFYLKITFVRGSGLTTGTAYVNLSWAKYEV